MKLSCVGVICSIRPILFPGAFKDATGGYDYTFYLAGSLILVSAIMCYPLNAINAWEKRRNGEQTEEKKAAKLV